MDDQHLNHESQQHQPVTVPSSNYLVPLAIVVAGVLIAGAVIYSSDKKATSPSVAGNNPAANAQLPQGETGSLDQMAPISQAKKAPFDSIAVSIAVRDTRKWRGK